MQDLSVFFRALADRKRLHIVQLLAECESMTVTQLGDELRLSQPLISWHLRILRKAGIVKTRRQGRQVWCSLNRVVLERYQDQIGDTFGLKSAPGDIRDAGLAPLEPVVKR